MLAIISSFKNYIETNLGLSIHVGIYKESAKLPLYLADTYEIYSALSGNQKYLLITPKNITNLSPANIQKHIQTLTQLSGLDCVYLCRAITAFNRNRLINYKVPFVVPGNQMYLPMAGIDLREYYRRQAAVKDSLTASAQAVILQVLNEKNTMRYTATNLAARLGYSVMTMSRAIEEISSLDMLRIKQDGKEKVLILPADFKEFWNNIQEKLSSPVKQIYWLKSLPQDFQGIPAGLTALSQLSHLSSPAAVTYAVDLKTSKSICSQYKKLITDTAEDDLTEIQTWKYNPGLFSKNGLTDYFSLFLSLRDTDDERVNQALVQMMEKVKW